VRKKQTDKKFGREIWQKILYVESGEKRWREERDI
jgi:hypothetical protein